MTRELKFRGAFCGIRAWESRSGATSSGFAASFALFFSDKLACLAIKLRRRIHRPFMMTRATQGIAFVFLTQFGFFKREYVCHAWTLTHL